MNIEEEHHEWVYQLNKIADELGGNITYSSTLDHTGRTSKKIVIEYDVKEKK